MEAALSHGYSDQSVSPYKSHIRNPKKFQHYPFISMPSAAVGLLQAPVHSFLSHSYPPPYSLQQSSQPPLLPLPAARPLRSASIQGFSCPSSSKKPNNGSRSRYSSFTPKKSKSPTKSQKKDKNSPEKVSENATVSSTGPLGPDPTELPKDVTKVLRGNSSGNVHSKADNYNDTNSSNPAPKELENQVGMLSGSAVFTISPPPSSLPLPTFSLRPKLSCNAEAAEIDAGATDNLRRLLQLR